MDSINRRKWMGLSGAALTLGGVSAGAEQTGAPGAAPAALSQILLKDYRPRSIYKIPKTDIQRAKYPVIDAHCHGPQSAGQLAEWVKAMDAANIERTVLLTQAGTVERFTQVSQMYARYRTRFDLWCGIDFTGIDQPAYGPKAVATLEECHRLGAVGVGEISDKGWGYRPPVPRGSPRPAPTPGAHPDDPKMDAVWEKCAQLGMPVNVHMSDPIWAYEPMDNTNDGLMNGYTWRIDDKAPGIYGHNALIASMERTLERHRKTVFVACHLLNLDYDLARLGQILDRHPNLYVDISARFAETAPIPRFVNQFFQKHPDRVLYGTDMPYNQRMLSTTFRILESNDEHFYERDLNFNFDYHWPLHGFGLSDVLLKKVYRDNALRAFAQARAGGRTSG